MSEPKLYTRNYIDEESVISMSSFVGAGGQTTTPYLFDRDPDSKFTTDGADDDADQVFIDIEFFEDGVEVERTIDRVMLINHNFKRWAFDYWDGSAWVESLFVETDDADVSVKTITPITAQKIRFVVDQTQIANAEKFAGEMIACELLAAPAQDMDAYEPSYRELSAEQIMGDGSLHKVVTRWAQNKTQRYEANVSFSYLSESDRLELKAIREGAEPFLWQPESAARPGEVYFVHWSSPWAERYVTSYKGAGTKINMRLKEV